MNVPILLRTSFANNARGLLGFCDDGIPCPFNHRFLDSRPSSIRDLNGLGPAGRLAVEILEMVQDFVQEPAPASALLQITCGNFRWTQLLLNTP